jgi:hypothetical protein
VTANEQQDDGEERPTTEAAAATARSTGPLATMVMVIVPTAGRRCLRGIGGSSGALGSSSSGTSTNEGFGDEIRAAPKEARRRRWLLLSFGLF